MMYFPTCCDGAKKLVVWENGKWIMDCSGKAIAVTHCPLCGSWGFTKKNNHQVFLERLEKSQKAVWSVAFWIMQENLKPVILHPTEFAPTASEQREFVDRGDLDVVDSIEPFTSKVINVKQLSYDFTSRADWPFGNEFIVSACHQVDEAKRPFHSIVYVNPDCTHLAILLMNTREHWWVKNKGDKDLSTKYNQDKYMCSPDLVRFYEMKLNGVKPQRSR